MEQFARRVAVVAAESQAGQVAVGQAAGRCLPFPFGCGADLLVEGPGPFEIPFLLGHEAQTDEGVDVVGLDGQDLFEGQPGGFGVAVLEAGAAEIVEGHDLVRVARREVLEDGPGRGVLVQAGVADAEGVAGQEVAFVGREGLLVLGDGVVDFALGEEPVGADVQGDGVEAGDLLILQQGGVVQGLAGVVQDVGAGEVQEGVARDAYGLVQAGEAFVLEEFAHGPRAFGLLHVRHVVDDAVHAVAAAQGRRAEEGFGAVGQGLEELLLLHLIHGRAFGVGRFQTHEQHGKGLGLAAHGLPGLQEIAVGVEAGQQVLLRGAGARLGFALLHQSRMLVQQRQLVPFLHHPVRVVLDQNLGDGHLVLDLHQGDLGLVHGRVVPEDHVPAGADDGLAAVELARPDQETLALVGVHAAAEVDDQPVHGHDFEHDAALGQNLVEGIDLPAAAGLGRVQGLLSFLQHQPGLFGRGLLELRALEVLGIVDEADAGRHGHVLAQGGEPGRDLGHLDAEVRRQFAQLGP
ncbi:hypothetical protein DSECCO2_511180 [anaerobic digester metagenome]